MFLPLGRLGYQRNKENQGETPKPQVDDGKLRVLGNCGAMAQVMTSPDVLKAFETSGSLVAYQGVPAFSDLVASDGTRLIAAVKKIGEVE